VKKLCADVFSRISDAWGVLGDEGKRAAYVKELEQGGNVDVMRILQAENVFQAATLLVKARRYEEAARKLDEAIQMNPDEAEFGIWAAWCAFLLAADKKRQHAASAAAIEAALKKNERCLPGYLFLGQMAKLAGETAVAERHLKRGLALAPDDPELSRELKYLKR
jgi:tetratricopeptide (TPR) repeat protein